jgi:hypothetical protein
MEAWAVSIDFAVGALALKIPVSEHPLLKDCPANCRFTTIKKRFGQMIVLLSRRLPLHLPLSDFN